MSDNRHAVKSPARRSGERAPRWPCLACRAVALRRGIGRRRYEEATEHTGDPWDLSAQHRREQAGEADQNSSDQGVQERVMVHKLETLATCLEQIRAAATCAKFFPDAGLIPPGERWSRKFMGVSPAQGSPADCRLSTPWVQCLWR